MSSTHIASVRTGRRRSVVVGAAVVATVLLWVLAQVLDVELRVDMNNGQPPMDIGLPLVIGFSLAASLAGWAVLALLERRTSRAATAWRVLAAVVLVLSLFPPLSAEATTGTRVILAAMHVAVGVVLIGALPGALPGTRRVRADTEEPA